MPHRHRHPLAVLLVALAAVLGGLTLAVVASGQTTDEPLSDYTVPQGDTVQTTPGTIPTTPPPPTLPPEREVDRPERDRDRTPPVQDESEVEPSVAASPPSGTPPSRSTQEGPSTLAFTGAEPLVVGGIGVLLIVAGFALHRRRSSGGLA